MYELVVFFVFNDNAFITLEPGQETVVDERCQQTIVHVLLSQ